MTIYVDDVRHRFRNMWMCHMWADTIDELHTEALALGLRMEWFQCPPKASWEHYDISLSMKAKALKRGAVLTDKYGPLVREYQRRLLLPRLPRDVRERLEEKLKTIANLRERRTTTDKANCRPQPTQGRLL